MYDFPSIYWKYGRKITGNVRPPSVCKNGNGNIVKNSDSICLFLIFRVSKFLRIPFCNPPGIHLQLLSVEIYSKKNSNSNETKVKIEMD